MESTKPPTAEETALEALRDWLNVDRRPDRCMPDSFTLHIQSPAGENFRAQASKLLKEVAYGPAEFREEEIVDKDGNKAIVSYLDAHLAQHAS